MIFDSLEQLDAYRESKSKVAAWICSTADVEPELPSHLWGTDRRECEDESGMTGVSEASARSCCFSIGLLLVPCNRWRKSATEAQIWSGNSSRLSPLVSEGGQGTDCSQGTQGEIAASTRSRAGVHVALEPTDFDCARARPGCSLQATARM